jgi:hypothetical protein
MAIPYNAAGYGNGSTAQNVFRVTFSTALSSAPDWEAYDGGSFPATGSGTTTANTIFAGTAGNGNIPMLSLVATTSSAPTSSWKPGSATAGSANPNRMKGLTNYVTDPTTPGASGVIRFNLVLELPSDATTSSTMAHDLLVRYTYTGSAPTLTWAGNDFGAGGSEGSPVWTNFVPGTNGIRHTRAGTVSGGPYLLNIPASSTVDSAMGWVTT